MPKVLAEIRQLETPLVKPVSAWQAATASHLGYHQGSNRHDNRSEPDKPMFTTAADMAEHLHKHGLLSHEEWTNQVSAIAEAYQAGFRPGFTVYRKSDEQDFKDGINTEDDLGLIIGYSSRPSTLSNVVGLFYYPVLVKWGKPEHTKHRMPYAYPIGELVLHAPKPANQAPVGDSGQTG